MSSWLTHEALDGLRRVELTRVVLGGSPSCVTTAVLTLHYADGRAEARRVVFPDGVMYETLVDQLSGVNRLLAG